MAREVFSMEVLQDKNNEFNLAIGRATARWAHIEAGLCQWFERITGMSSIMSRRIFYSVAGFDGRRRMLLAAIDSAELPNGMSPYLALLAGKAANYSGSRNRMVHGDPVFINESNSKHHGTLILLEGGEPWATDPRDNMLLTLTDLTVMTDNFRYLGALIADSLNWDGDKSRLPSRWTEQVRAMPREAHASRLDPSIAVQFQSELKLGLSR